MIIILNVSIKVIIPYCKIPIQALKQKKYITKFYKKRKRAPPMEKHFTISDITAVICTINEEKRIARCIKSLIEIGIKDHSR